MKTFERFVSTSTAIHRGFSITASEDQGVGIKSQNGAARHDHVLDLEESADLLVSLWAAMRARCPSPEGLDEIHRALRKAQENLP